MKRREFITLIGGGGGAWAGGGWGEQPAKILQIGLLYSGTKSVVGARVVAFLSGLQAGGLRAEEISMIPHVADGDGSLLATMAADLVARKVDLILAISPAAVRAAKLATSTIPILANDLESDPIGSGFIASNAR